MSKSCDVECLTVIHPNVGLGGFGHEPDARRRLFPCPQFFGPATDAVSTKLANQKPPTCSQVIYKTLSHVGQSFVNFIPDFFDEFDVPSPIISPSAGLPRGEALRVHNSRTLSLSRTSSFERPRRGVHTEFLKEKGVDVGLFRHAVLQRGTHAVAGGGRGAQ